MSRLTFTIAIMLAAATVTRAADGPRVERVVVEKPDGTTAATAAPEPRVLRARAIPAPEEIARLRAEKARPVVAAKPGPVPSAPPVAVAAPPVAVAAPLVVVATPPITVAARPPPRPAYVPPPPPTSPPAAALGAPVRDEVPAPDTLTARDRESLRWLKRLHAKYPDRFDRMMADNPRARWLVGEEAKLSAPQRRALHNREDEDEEEREDDDDE